MIRQAILRGPRTLDLAEVPPPAPGPGEVVVRVRAALTCGTDLKTFRRGHPRLPFGPFGHEAAGDVETVGAGVRHVAPGQAVVFTPTAPCGACAACGRGRENLCAHLFDAIALGAYADAIRLPARVAARHLFPKPDGLDYAEAACLEPLACVVHGWRRLGATRGAVAVVGLGPIGLLFVQLAAGQGLEVVAVGRRPEGLARARACGAAHTVDAAAVADVGAALRALGRPDGPEAVIEATGAQVVWEAAPGWAAPGGRVLLFGGLAGGSRPAFDAARLHYSEVDLISAFHYTTADVHEALGLLAARAIRPGLLIAGARPLSRVREIFDDLDRGAGVKYAVIPDGAP
ncbi:MAG: alcohol dehydrogenase catalytic domain-containing protein [Armatimonadota bacterium]|nr:alcohol dehydrogenase catalytic domain-containing protein [Armatimonadota bacterium]MDR7536270.1 alcohol dehydrogenase catalytic domain-containing protein [Armatimonadota bacterium]